MAQLTDNAVYNQLHRYAFDELKKIIENPLSKDEYNNALEFLKSANATTEEEKEKSAFIQKITMPMYKGTCKNFLTKDVSELTNDEKILYNKNIEDIKNVIKKETRTKKIEEVKNELEQQDISVINTNDGKNLMKMTDSVGNTVLTEMVGNSVGKILDEEASFIVDGSSNSLKSADNFASELKKHRITNDNMVNVNTANTNNLQSDTQEEIAVIKSTMNLDNANYDTKMGVAVTEKGKVLDTNNTNEQINVQELDKNNTTLETVQKKMTKQELFEYISELEEKGVNKEEASKLLNNIPTFSALSEDTKANIINCFHSLNEEKQNNLNNAKTLVKTYDSKINNAAKVSSIVISFIAGIISGVVLMLLVYFFITH